MKTTCSIREVARHANVAASTVSRVLNNRMGDLRVAKETRDKIIAAASQLNYAPNINARRLFSRKTGIIGLLVPSYRRMGQHIFEDNHLTRIISGLEKGIGGQKYSLLLLFNDDDFIREKRYLSLFREQNIDGLLIWGAYEHETFWEELAAEGWPHLFLSNIPSSHERLNYLISDNEQAGYAVTRHLLEKGHRQLAWIGGKSEISINRQQECGVRRALAEYGLGWESLTIGSGDYKLPTGENAIEEWLRQGKQFTALISANYDMALGALAGLRRRKIAIPEEMAIACCDSLQDLGEGSPDLTRIETRDLEIGEIAAEKISSLIDHPGQLVQIRHGIDFVQGQTT